MVSKSFVSMGIMYKYINCYEQLHFKKLYILWTIDKKLKGFTPTIIERSIN